MTFARKDFKTQLPDWVPLEIDDTVVYSGLAEIVLGISPVLTDEEHQKTVRRVVAAFFRPFSRVIFLNLIIEELS